MDRFCEEWPPVQQAAQRECPHCSEPIAEHESTVMQANELWHTSCLRRSREDEPEPECTCHQTDVDLFDARGCELHDSRSGWNYRQEQLRLITEDAA